jgi:hypothetical protein
MNRDSLITTARHVVELATHYKGRPNKEMGLDGLLYGVLWAKFKVVRQFHVRKIGKTRPNRIDFKQRGLNPVVIEFVTRTENRGEIYGSQNRSELVKLSKQIKMKSRFLLLLDISGERPISESRLRETYKPIKTTRGRYPRTSVRVIYIHPTHQYHFLWQPRKRLA